MKTVAILLVGLALVPRLEAQRWSTILLDETVSGKSGEYTVSMNSQIVYRVERQASSTHWDLSRIAIAPVAADQPPGLFRETPTNDPDTRLYYPRVSGAYRVRIAAPSGGTLRIRILIDSVDNPDLECVRESHGMCEAVKRRT